MNLLTDKWIPVQKEGKRQLIRLQDVLCNDEAWSLSLPRDDMEMACLQLMICLTQVIFTPEDAKDLRLCIREPMHEEDYQKGIADYLDWFDLNHPKTPFMQVRGVKATKITGVQKMFAGLPEGGGTHCFFNDKDELKSIGLPATAIALFNQAMNCPSFGGGFKGGFRGSAPVTTLAHNEHLRRRVWSNILHENSLRLLMPNYDKLKGNDKPVWVEPTKARSSISASSIGLLRGLFWQPAHIELIVSDGGYCDLFGSDEVQLVTGFNKEKFVYEVVGQWVHPHSPRYWYTVKKKKEEKYLSFRSMAPAWGQLSYFIMDKHGQAEGQQSASVIAQFRALYPARKCLLIVGGYRNKKASIIQRRHELLPLAEGWDAHINDLSQLVDAALGVKTKMVQVLCLFGVMAGTAKRNKKRNKSISSSGLVKYSEHLDEYPFEKFEDFFDGVHQGAEAMFYHNSEQFIHETLRNIDWRESKKVKEVLVKKLIQLSWNIFNEVIKPYQHEPKMILAIAVAKRTLDKEFRKIQGGQA